MPPFAELATRPRQDHDAKTRSSSKDETNVAAVLAAPGRFDIKPTSPPECSADQVLIRVRGCGVCASSLPVWEGREWFEYPMAAGAPGHEGWGEIVSVGSKVSGGKSGLLIPGQRVAFLGGPAYARFVAVPATDVVVLPPELDGMPFPGEAIGCAMNIFRRADIQSGHNVAVIGAGFLGLLLVQLAKQAGATVYALSRRESARALAETCGASATFDTEDWWGNAHKVVELTGGRGCERVIEVTGLQFALDTATEMVAEYGKLVIAGYHQDGLRQVNMQKWNWNAIDVINAHERDPQRYIEGIEAGVEATVSGRIRPQDLLTHSFELDELDLAFRQMTERPDGFVKGWVRL
ncbi:MDR/zinc-dependent alcohol dehydrogenase-like family protein [Allohahella sp. A8]|uniref:MDR/zinc-dependent alcohol dehydrogenase-like family protein n=1 Tax=Allohahella sp. A8 TaxID=3141461 RepID=UPI003A809143